MNRQSNFQKREVGWPLVRQTCQSDTLVDRCGVSALCGFFFFLFTFCLQIRYFRKLRANSVAAAARKKELRAATHPRPRPKTVEHIEDILFKNGLRFVRPGTPKIFGVTLEGIPIDSTASGKQ